MRQSRASSVQECSAASSMVNEITIFAGHTAIALTGEWIHRGSQTPTRTAIATEGEVANSSEEFASKILSSIDGVAR